MNKEKNETWNLKLIPLFDIFFFLHPFFLLTLTRITDTVFLAFSLHIDINGGKRIFLPKRGNKDKSVQ